MKKIVVVIGVCLEYGLLCWVIDEIYYVIELQLQFIVIGGYLFFEQGLIYCCIEEDGYDIDVKVDMLLFLDCVFGIVKFMGMCSIGMSDVFLYFQFDMIVVLGDRYELFFIVGIVLVMCILIVYILGGDIIEGVIDNEVCNVVIMMFIFYFLGI